ncbi:hypothetical protein [Streptomyces sp. NPDC047061]
MPIYSTREPRFPAVNIDGAAVHLLVIPMQAQPTSWPPSFDTTHRESGL